MIHHQIEQNTPEWRDLRLGIPTSSEFDKIITPKTRKLSSQAAGYTCRLLAEWITGQQIENVPDTFAMRRGHELEPAAVLAYEMLTDRETTPGGFITTDDGMLGCSPDRLFEDVGDVEMKCPFIHTQVEYALTGIVAEEYKAQLQGRLLIHGREWVEIFSYHPSLSIEPVRVYRDEDFISAMRPILEQFVENLLEKRRFIEDRFGPFERAGKSPEIAAEMAAFPLTQEWPEFAGQF